MVLVYAERGERMTEHEGFHFSVVEAAILEAIDHVGWYAYLWFPVVYREVLNFPLEAPDEQVHAAFGSLIRKGALQVTPSKQGEIPQWGAAHGALEVARNVLSLSLDLREGHDPSEPL